MPSIAGVSMVLEAWGEGGVSKGVIGLGKLTFRQKWIIFTGYLGILKMEYIYGKICS